MAIAKSTHGKSRQASQRSKPGAKPVKFTAAQKRADHALRAVVRNSAAAPR